MEDEMEDETPPCKSPAPKSPALKSSAPKGSVDAPRYVVQPVAKALMVLEYVLKAGRELSLTEIHSAVRLPKTTAFRYLQTLYHAKMIAYDPRSDRYRSGVHLYLLAQTTGGRPPLAHTALPVMQQIRDQFNETVNLGRLNGAEVVYIEMVESRRSLRMQAQIGGQDPAYCTAVGKAILAFLPGQTWREHLPPRLLARTEDTIVDVAKLRAELVASRERGYSLDEGENEEGSCCIGVPIVHGGFVIAGLSVSAPASRVTAVGKTRIADSLKAGAADIANRLKD